MANSLSQSDCGLSHLRVIVLCLRHCGKVDLLAYAFSVLICLYLRAGLRVKPSDLSQKDIKASIANAGKFA